MNRLHFCALIDLFMSALNFSFPVDRMNSLRAAAFRRPTAAARAMFYRTRGSRDEGRCGVGWWGTDRKRDGFWIEFDRAGRCRAAQSGRGVVVHCAVVWDYGIYFLRLRRRNVQRPVGRAPAGVASDLWKPDSQPYTRCVSFHVTTRFLHSWWPSPAIDEDETVNAYTPIDNN